jgi:hypothetical protein
LEDLGVSASDLNYSLYVGYVHSIGFTQRGCRLRCPFLRCTEKEGGIAEQKPIHDVWRDPLDPRNLLLLDDDFFGAPGWRERIDEIRDGTFRVCFSQGMNARLLTGEAAGALASIRFYDDDFRRHRIYTVWDNRKHEARLFARLNALVRYGVKPGEVLVYMLIGY